MFLFTSATLILLVLIFCKLLLKKSQVSKFLFSSFQCTKMNSNFEILLKLTFKFWFIFKNTWREIETFKLDSSKTLYRKLLSTKWFDEKNDKLHFINFQCAWFHEKKMEWIDLEITHYLRKNMILYGLKLKLRGRK